MEISEKVAYLKGLAEGLALDTDTKEGKLIAAIIDVLDDMSEKFVAHAYSIDGGLAVLKGNIAVDGCVVKTAGVDESIWKYYIQYRVKTF